MKTNLNIERLESRLAPSSGGTFIDLDGDKVSLMLSSGTMSTTFTSAGLVRIDLSGATAGANLIMKVTKAPGGDGLCNVGYIDATGVDLGHVTIRGDLGRIDAGSNTAGTTAIKSLSVRSMGRLGLDSQGGVGDLKSNIHGALGALKVTGDVKDAYIVGGQIGAIRIGGSLIGGSAEDSGQIYSFGDMGAVKIGHDVQGGSGINSGDIYSTGKLAGVNIGGSLIGGTNDYSGEIYSSGDMGAVKIGHDVQGGSGSSSGFILSHSKLASVSIGGSLIGGSNDYSGVILSSGDMGTVKIGHDVLGGSGSESGYIDSGGKLACVSIGGSLIGGSGDDSGQIYSNRDLGAVKIGHDLTGGSITGAASLDGSGVIVSFGRIASVTIGGSIISGIDTSVGTLTRNATIRAANDIGSLSVRGSLIGHGNTPNSAASPVIISARGQAVQGATTDLAIGKIRIGGRVEFANILAGYDTFQNAVNGDAQIGAMSVGGDWAASNLVAGAMNAAPGNMTFGDGNDTSIGAGSAGIIAKIASITIKGQVYGTPDSVSSTDHYGFVAEQVVAVTIGGVADALSPGPHNNAHPVGETTDMAVFEVV